MTTFITTAVRASNPTMNELLSKVLKIDSTVSKNVVNKSSFYGYKHQNFGH
jgi:hypothetical protein